MHHTDTPSRRRATDDPYVDLAPGIHRQRLVIEGVPAHVVTDEHIRAYLAELSEVIEMIPLMEPVTHHSAQYGWAGWIHWETSGAHFYAWDDPELFFSVDVYACKPFAPDVAVGFTRSTFETSAITWREG